MDIGLLVVLMATGIVGLCMSIDYGFSFKLAVAWVAVAVWVTLALLDGKESKTEYLEILNLDTYGVKKSIVLDGGQPIGLEAFYDNKKFCAKKVTVDPQWHKGIFCVMGTKTTYTPVEINANTVFSHPQHELNPTVVR